MFDQRSDAASATSELDPKTESTGARVEEEEAAPKVPPTPADPPAPPSAPETGKDGYKVIVPSPSKRMMLLRLQETSGKPGNPPKRRREYKTELTGDTDLKMAKYEWPEAPEKWSTIEEVPDCNDQRVVNGKLVKKPDECHFAVVDGNPSHLWALAPNPTKKGVCGSGEERDIDRYGKVGEFEVGELLLVPDGKRNQFWDAGWYTGYDLNMPAPYGRCVLLEWADTSKARGSKMDLDAWRPVFVPVSRLIKAPERDRRTTCAQGSRRSSKKAEGDKKKDKQQAVKTKVTDSMVARMSLGTDVVFKGSLAHAVMGRNRRESTVWVRETNLDYELVGEEEELICYYTETLDPFSPNNLKLASQMKPSLLKIVQAKQRKDRLAHQKKQSSGVDSRLTANMTALSSVMGSPILSETLAPTSSTPLGTDTPKSTTSSSAAAHNLHNLLHGITPDIGLYGAYGPPKDSPFSETEFWKHEANTFLAEAKSQCQTLQRMQNDMEQNMANQCIVNETIRKAVMSNIELLKKNIEISEKNSITASQLTGLVQNVAKFLGYRLHTDAAPKTPQRPGLDDTTKYLGQALCDALTATTPMTYRTTVYGSQRLAAVESPSRSAKKAEVAVGARSSRPSVSSRTPNVNSPRTPRPDTPEASAVLKSSYIPTKPKGPWSQIDLNSLFFKLDPKYVQVRKMCGLRLGRPIGQHEWNAVKWIGWQDCNFDAFTTFKEPSDFERFLAGITYTQATSGGTGLDEKVLGNFFAFLKKGQQIETPKLKRSASQALSPTDTATEPKVMKLNKAQLKLLEQKDPASSQDSKHRKKVKIPAEVKKKEEKVHKKALKKRGLARGGKRKAMDPKLKLAWDKKIRAKDFNVATKSIWGEGHIATARASVDNLVNKATPYKQYRFVEKLFKLMLVGKLCPTVLDADDFKHAMISMRNELRKLEKSGWRAQEEACKQYEFFWAATELFKDTYPHGWHVAADRDRAQLFVAEKCAGLGKAWCTTKATPQKKKRKVVVQKQNEIEVQIEADPNLQENKQEEQRQEEEQPTEQEPKLEEQVDEDGENKGNDLDLEEDNFVQNIDDPAAADKLEQNAETQKELADDFDEEDDFVPFPEQNTEQQHLEKSLEIIEENEEEEDYGQKGEGDEFAEQLIDGLAEEDLEVGNGQDDMDDVVQNESAPIDNNLIADMNDDASDGENDFPDDFSEHQSPSPSDDSDSEDGGEDDSGDE